MPLPGFPGSKGVAEKATSSSPAPQEVNSTAVIKIIAKCFFMSSPAFHRDILRRAFSRRTAKLNETAF